MTARALLKRIAKAPLALTNIRNALDGDEPEGQGRLVPGRAGSQVWRVLLADGLVTLHDDHLHLTDAGRMHLRRLLSGAEDAFRAQHQAQVPGDVEGGQAVGSVPAPVPERRAGQGPRIDLSESPLAWLARRTDARGKALLDRAQVEAGERLRQDFTFGGMMPSLAGGWRTERVSGGGAGAGIDLADHVLAARTRVERALEAVGASLSPVLVDVCCLLKGLETVERERGWPPRSGKVVLGLALTSLGAHYGLGVSGVRPRSPRPHPGECARPST